MNEILKISGTIFMFMFTLLSFFLALRSELKKSADQFAELRIENDRRIAFTETSIQVIQEKLNSLEKTISIRMETISDRINEVYDLFLQHLEEENS